MRFWQSCAETKSRLSDGRTSPIQQVRGKFQQSADLARPVIHGEVRHLVQAHDHLRVLAVRQLDHRSVFGQTGTKNTHICVSPYIYNTHTTSEALTSIPPAGHQQLVLAEGKSDLKPLQQCEELRHVALGETFCLVQELLHQRALDDAFGRLPEPAALQGQFLHTEHSQANL